MTSNAPPDVLEALTKLARLGSLMERTDLSAVQKCVGFGILYRANEDGVSTVSTQYLQQVATIKRRETVAAATHELHEKQIIEKSHRNGEIGRYLVMPLAVVAEVEQAFHDQTGRQFGDQTGPDVVSTL